MSSPEAKDRYGKYFWALALATVLAYSNSFSVPFQFDDYPNIVGNEFIRSLWNIPEMFIGRPGALSSRPLVLASFAVDYALWGTDTEMYHMENLLLHLLAGWLLYRFVTEAFDFVGWRADIKGPVALMTAGMFLLHPLQTESVTYIVTRSVLMSSVFYFAGLILFIRLVQAPEWEKNKLWALLFVVSLCGMASRETFAPFVAIVLIFDYIFVARFNFKELYRRRWIHLSLWLTFLYAIYITVSTGAHAETVGLEKRIYSPFEYFAAQHRVYLTYLRLIFLPINQNLDYDYPAPGHLMSAGVIFPSALYAGMWAIALLRLRKNPVLSFCVLWFLITPTPDSSLVPLGSLIFEHRIYMAAVPVFFMLAAGMVMVLSNGKLADRGMAVALIFVLLLGVLAYERNEVWGGIYSLWSDVVNKAPRKVRGYNNIALFFETRGEDEALMMTYGKILEMYPENLTVHKKLGIHFLGKKQYEEAAKWYLKADELAPGQCTSLYSLGLAYAYSKKFDEAVGAFSRCVAAADDSELVAQSYFMMGNIMAAREDFAKARNHYVAALEAVPGHDNARMMLDALDRQQGGLSVSAPPQQ